MGGLLGEWPVREGYWSKVITREVHGGNVGKRRGAFGEGHGGILGKEGGATGEGYGVIGKEVRLLEKDMKATGDG